MLQLEQLAELVPDFADRETWTCGPTGLLDAAESHWTSLGILERLHTERFRPAIVVTGDGGTVEFGASNITVKADAGTPILSAGEAAGVLMPSGCRMGICFGCVVPLRSGAVRDLRTGALTTAADGDGVKIQTCISAAAGDCHIDL
jgi:ferredoxin